MTMFWHIPVIDLIALTIFVAMWVGYTILAEHRTLLGRSLSAVTAHHRLAWMREMCNRDNRVSDASLTGYLMRSVSFFASASILVVGGLMALMGSGERAYVVYREMPFADNSGLESFELKVMLMACVFVYAFFQMTWSIRQFNYVCILMGGSPPTSASEEEKNAFAANASRLQALAGDSFNRGLRAYYFALAMLMWFVSVWGFLAASTVVIAVLYRREFHSRSLKTLTRAMGREQL